VTKSNRKNWTNFKDNPIAIQAGLIGSEYGQRPHKVLGLHGKTDLEAFWLDAAVRQATVQFRKERQEQAQNQRTGAGTASAQQHNELHAEQEQRADLRESMEQAGQQAPSPEGQLERLDELHEQREQANQQRKTGSE